MIPDHDLYFARNQRPAITPGALILPWMLPTGLAGNDWLDFRTAIDRGLGGGVWANFEITTTFGGGAAQNFLRFMIAVDDVSNFVNIATNPGLRLVRGPDIATAGLVAGTKVSLALPPLNSIAIPGAQEFGRRFFGLGLEASVPATDWDAGGITAWLAAEPIGIRVPYHPAGW